jgi:hypothetical protein
MGQKTWHDGLPGDFSSRAIKCIWVPLVVLGLLICQSFQAKSQNAAVQASTDARQITVGDQVRVFIEARNNPKESRLIWATIPDSFDHLEVVEKGKIDTSKQGDLNVYKQRVLVTGFDSGSYRIPAFAFSIIPNTGTAYTLQTDSFQLLVQTVPVDTTKPFKPIKDIIAVKSSWMDYLGLGLALLVFVLLATFAIIFFIKNKKAPVPVVESTGPPETLQERALRQLTELEQEQLWQNNRIKQYYTQITDILRDYIEQRFHTPAMELTTDELLNKVQRNKEMKMQYDLLASILYTADLAKFAKAQPLPHEHTEAMELAKQFIIATKPLPTPTQPDQI